MTFPNVTETSPAPQPVDRDTFADAAERARPPWPLPRRRPADA